MSPIENTSSAIQGSATLNPRALLPLWPGVVLVAVICALPLGAPLFGLEVSPALLATHIAAGGAAIVLGAVALSVKKGGTVHRLGGLLFVCAMLVMGTSGSLMGGLKNGHTDGNVFAGIMTIYFVGTALTTVRPASPWTARINVAALAVALGLAFIGIMGGVKALNSPGRALNGVPFFMNFFIATVMILAAAGDVRIMRSGPLHGGRRLARHLWRMCFALFIAAGSFFSIRDRVATVLPEPFTTAPMRMLPILLLFGAMFYWLWRVRRRRPLPVIIRNDSIPPAPRDV
ncbi:MAG TPA: DUF2306 domain-containing protein [Opitutaceae bacterium]|nr:DUF2306 domain-containing protein [Opitutaceae bacterium]